jgi:hypothetical protein
MQFFMIAAIMEPHNGDSHSPHRSSPTVVAPPSYWAQRHRPVDRTALTPRAGLAGHVARVRHVDQRPHVPRRRAARLNRRALKPQRSWHAISIMGPPELGLIRVWVGLLVGFLVLAGPRVSAAWPALDRPRTSGDNAVSPLLDDRDLEDDSRAALARRTTGVLGLSPATIKGHAAVMSSHCWPPRYFVRPQLLTRFSPLPMGRDLHASIECGGIERPRVAPLLPAHAP